MEPWFDAGRFGWIPTLLSAAVGISTGIAGEVLAPKGSGRKPIFTSLYIQIAGSLLLVAAGLYGRWAGQPEAVWTSLLIPGVVGCVVVSLSIVRLRKIYRKAAAKAMAAGHGV